MSYFQIVVHEGKAMGVQWYENIKAEEQGQARAREVLERAFYREKRKHETVLAQHESKAIADIADNTIANSPATALVEQYGAIANPAVGSPCPGGTDGVVERAISRRGMQYLH